MNRKMSPRGHRRRQSNSEPKYAETSADFNVDDESDSNIKYTSTPMKTSATGDRFQRQSSAPNFDSEESTDPVVRARERPSKRRRKERVADHGDRRRRRSKRRRNDDTPKDEHDENDEMERLRNEKKVHKPGDASILILLTMHGIREVNECSGIVFVSGDGEREFVELPIADLLRKAQENQKSLQTRYEDPTPLPELTTDTVYVQGKKGFSAVKIGNYRNERGCGDRSLKPIHVAIRIHDFSRTLMFFCQGLLGGIALCQVILVSLMKSTASHDCIHSYLLYTRTIFRQNKFRKT